MGHRDLLSCDPTLLRSPPLLVIAHAKRPPLSGFVQVTLEEVAGMPADLQDLSRCLSRRFGAGIIAGYGRLLAARKLQLQQVPPDHLSETQKRAYILADNKLALNAGWMSSCSDWSWTRFET